MPVVGAAALQLFWLFVGFPEASLVLPCQLCGFIINAVDVRDYLLWKPESPIPMDELPRVHP